MEAPLDVRLARGDAAVQRCAQAGLERPVPSRRLVPRTRRCPIGTPELRGVAHKPKDASGELPRGGDLAPGKVGDELHVEEGGCQHHAPRRGDPAAPRLLGNASTTKT